MTIHNHEIENHAGPARVQSPWRRFFARSFDLSLCSLPWSLLLLVFGVHITYVAETDDLGDYAGVHFLMEKVQ